MPWTIGQVWPSWFEPLADVFSLKKYQRRKREVYWCLSAFVVGMCLSHLTYFTDMRWKKLIAILWEKTYGEYTMFSTVQDSLYVGISLEYHHQISELMTSKMSKNKTKKCLWFEKLWPKTKKKKKFSWVNQQCIDALKVTTNWGPLASDPLLIPGSILGIVAIIHCWCHAPASRTFQNFLNLHSSIESTSEILTAPKVLKCTLVRTFHNHSVFPFFRAKFKLWILEGSQRGHWVS